MKNGKTKYFKSCCGLFKGNYYNNYLPLLWVKLFTIYFPQYTIRNVLPFISQWTHRVSCIRCHSDGRSMNIEQDELIFHSLNGL